MEIESQNISQTSCDNPKYTPRKETDDSDYQSVHGYADHLQNMPTKKKNTSRLRDWFTKHRSAPSGLRSLLCFSPVSKRHTTLASMDSDYEFVRISNYPVRYGGTEALIPDDCKTDFETDNQQSNANYYSLEKPSNPSKTLVKVETENENQSDYSVLDQTEFPHQQNLPIQCSIESCAPDMDSIYDHDASDGDIEPNTKDIKPSGHTSEQRSYTGTTEDTNTSHGEGEAVQDSGVNTSTEQLPTRTQVCESASELASQKIPAPVPAPRRVQIHSQLAANFCMTEIRERANLHVVAPIGRDTVGFEDGVITHDNDESSHDSHCAGSMKSEELTFSEETNKSSETEQPKSQPVATQKSSPGATSVDEQPYPVTSTLGKPGALTTDTRADLSERTASFELLDEGDKDVRKKDPHRKKLTRQDKEEGRTIPIESNQLAGPSSRSLTVPAASASSTYGPSPASTPSSQAFDENSRALIDSLSKEGAPDGYAPIPNNIKEFINREAKKKNVEGAAIYQSPRYPKELLIMGDQATSLSSVQNQFPGYSFMFTHTKDARHIEEYIDDKFLTLDISKFCYDRTTNDYVLDRETMCGLILVGKTRSHNPIEALYLVSPAHFVLSMDQCTELTRVNGKLIDEVRIKVESEAAFNRYLLGSHNSPVKNDTNKLPMLAYRHFKPPNSSAKEFYEFTNDLALLQIAPEQVMGESTTQPGHKRENLESTMTKREDFPHSLTKASFDAHYTHFDDIFPLIDHNMLKEMGHLRVRVFIGQDTGYMIPCGERVDSRSQRKWTYAIEFVTKKRKFQHGDCGLIVSVQNRDTKVLYPFGMFIGKSLRKHKCGWSVWVAVVLRQGIDDIESHYKHLVQDLRPISCPMNSEATNNCKLSRLSQNTEGRMNQPACGKASDEHSRERTLEADSGAHSMTASRFAYADA
ncbi:uncharacterized protein [Watersipora subatra]|uniref:uncharacterized protein isoform X2 n=1 Tax=Watersipora subatra TaxID=2589382 RepID=UPI00355B86DB